MNVQGVLKNRPFGGLIAAKKRIFALISKNTTRVVAGNIPPQSARSSMELIGSINERLGNVTKAAIQPGARLKPSASWLSIYFCQAFKRKLELVGLMAVTFASSSFIPVGVAGVTQEQRREFRIPNAEIGRIFYGAEFAVQLKQQADSS